MPHALPFNLVPPFSAIFLPFCPKEEVVSKYPFGGTAELGRILIDGAPGLEVPAFSCPVTGSPALPPSTFRVLYTFQP